MSPTADSVASLTLALLLAVSMLVRQCLSAPAAAVELSPDRWQHPCGEASRPESPLPPLAHTRHPSKQVKMLKTQLQIVRTYYNVKAKKEIATLYSGMQMMRRENYKYEWLPQDQFEWYQKEVMCDSGPKQVSKVLPALHRSLQNFSITFDAMRTYGETAISNDDLATRNKFLGDLSNQHKGLLCQTEIAIHNLGMPLPEHSTGDILPEDKWDVKPNHSGLKLRDWGVISMYKTFLNDWHKIIKQVVTKKPPAKCRRAKIPMS